MAFTEGTQTQKSENYFTPEGLQAMLADFQALQDILTRMSGVHGGLLGYFGSGMPLEQTALAQPTKKAAGMARKAVKTAGQQQGMSDRSLASTDAALGAQTPELLSPLGQLAQQYAGGMNSLVDPRLASFLRPDTVTSSENTPSGLDTATKIIGTAGQIADAYYG